MTQKPNKAPEPTTTLVTFNDGRKKMKSVFILWHTHEIPDQEEDSKLIGVYESREAAERAKERVIKQPGFAEHPKGFLIDEYQVGKDHWTEGFVTVYHSEE